MDKTHLLAAAAALLAVVSTQGQSFAQYGDQTPAGSPGISEQTLAQCTALGIDRSQCTESNVLLKERVGMVEGGGSGTGFLAGAGQMIVMIGALGAIFGGIAGAFLLKGRGKQVRTA